MRPIIWRRKQRLFSLYHKGGGTSSRQELRATKGYGQRDVDSGEGTPSRIAYRTVDSTVTVIPPLCLPRCLVFLPTPSSAPTPPGPPSPCILPSPHVFSTSFAGMGDLEKGGGGVLVGRSWMSVLCPHRQGAVLDIGRLQRDGPCAVDISEM